jgi:hypothetical protein
MLAAAGFEFAAAAHSLMGCLSWHSPHVVLGN